MKVKWWQGCEQIEGIVVAFCSEASFVHISDYNVIRAVVKVGNKLQAVDLVKLEIIEDE